jgi:hypothetical protein
VSEFETITLGWKLRDDGDVDFQGQVVPLEEFIASGRMGPDQIKLARERAAKARFDAWRSGYPEDFDGDE